MTAAVLQSHIAGRWLGAKPAQQLRSAVNGQPVASTHAEGIDFGEAVHYARTSRPAQPAEARLPAARRDPASTRQIHHREQGSAVRRVGAHRRHAQRRLDRHRRRQRHAVRVLERRQQRAAVGQRGARGAGDPLEQEGRLRGHAHPGAAARRGGAHQRVQLSGVGPAREIRAHLSGRHAVHRQAGHRHQLPHRGAGALDRQVRTAARRRAAAGDRRHRRPARQARRPGRGHLHRQRRHRGQAARAPQHREALDPVQRRGRLAELRDPRARRDARRRGVRSLRQGGGARDDREGRPEVHRDPPRHRAARARRHRGRAAAQPPGQDRGGRPVERDRAHGRAGVARAGQRRGRARGRAHARRRDRVFGQGRLQPHRHRRGRGRVLRAHAAAGQGCGQPRRARRRSLRPGEHADAVRHARRGRGAGRARPRQPGGHAGHQRPRHCRAGGAADRRVARPPAGARPRSQRWNPPATAARCRA